MGMFDHFPYTNFHELNMDWILQVLKEIEKTMDQFVAINSLKYADPIQWNIVRQYEKNTIVIDPLTGTAYISVEAVPSGVALTNEDYWTVVFDLGIFVTRAAKNFTNRWEKDTTLTATFPTSVGDWLVWGDTLYKALVNITAGDQYVIGSNIEHFTMEELYNDHVSEFTLKILNIMGSIGVNELDATSATQNLNAGVLVWVSGQLYMTLTPITTGTAFTPGTNITPVNVNDFILDRINNNVQDLRGAIAINEGSSTTATVNISSGHLVWINSSLYMTMTNINIGDIFVPGTNITAVHIDDYILNRINVLVANELAKYSTDGYKVANKKFLFVGDSFGDSSNRGFNCWPEIFATNLDLSADQWTNLCTDSAGIWNSTPSLTFLYQLQNYTGNKNEITDIIIGEATNDSFNSDPNSVQYASVKTYFSDIVDYVNANYPNATLYVASIGNGIDVSPNIGVRVYGARSAFRKNLFEWCGEYGVKILNDCEYALSGGLEWFLSDQIHPNPTGETKLGNAISRAYLSKNANVMYCYKDEYNVFGSNPHITDTGNMVSSVVIQNGVTNTRILNIAMLVTQGYTISQDFPLLGSPHIWYNEDMTVSGYIRLHAFDGESERLLPCEFIFRENGLFLHIHDIKNGNFVTSWTADAGAYITIDMITASTNSDRIA